MRAKLPRIIGTNQLADETALAGEDGMFVRKAENVDIDSAGNISRRKGPTQLLNGSGYHSLYSSKRGWLMLCLKEDLGIFDTTNQVFQPIAALNSNDLVSYTEENGILYAMNSTSACMFKPNDLTPYTLGIPLPNVVPEFIVSTSKGSLEPGRYGVTYSVVSSDGEESPLGAIVEVELEEPGMVLGSPFPIINGFKYRIYMTTENGEELYQAGEFDADQVYFEILDHDLGRQPGTQGLEPPPYGHIIRAYNSRLLIGSTDFVFFTEAFRPHLYNPAHGFVATAGFTLMVEPVEGGVFIGDKRGVRFYKGNDPQEWTEREVSPDKPVFGTSTSVPGSFFTGDLARFDEVAVWLTAKGYQVGLPTGEVVSLNAGQVKLPNYVRGCSAYTVRDGRKQLISPVNSNELADAGYALDSVIN